MRCCCCPASVGGCLGAWAGGVAGAAVSADTGPPPAPKRAPARPDGLTRHRPPAPSQAGELFDALLATEGGRLPAPRALGWFAQLASAVAHCHKHGAVHGQLHPENVLLAAADCLQVAPAPLPASGLDATRDC